MKKLKIGLWSDCHNFPSVPLMKLSAYHKQKGDTVDFANHFEHYDLVYASKVFSFTDDIEDKAVINADKIIRNGTGYCITVDDGKEIFDTSKNISLPKEIEHIYPDYSLYPDYKYATGFLTRGCPRNCKFCVVGKKEGLCSRQVSNLSEFWRGEQKEIKLLDPNLLACKEHEKILQELIDSKVSIDFTQGLDIRFINKDNIKLLNQVRTKVIHFAWDNPKQDLTEQFKLFIKHTNITNIKRRSVYVLTNFDSTIEEDLYRIYTLRDLGYNPYVMVYQKETAPKEICKLQRWVNCRKVFGSVKNFEDYKWKD